MILVQAAPAGAGKGTARMAVVLKINPGFDASYPWREIGTGARPEAGQRARLLPRPRRQGRGTGRPVGRAGPGDAELHRGAGDRPERCSSRCTASTWTRGTRREDQAGAGRAAVHPGAGDLQGPGGGRAARQPGAAGRAADSGQGAGQARRAVLGCHRVGVQVHHLVLRRPARRRGAGPAERGRRRRRITWSGARGGCGPRSWRATGRRWSTCRTRRG